VIDTVSATVTKAITVGSRPIGVAVAPDGEATYVAVSGSNEMLMMNNATNLPLLIVALGSGGLVDMAVHPRGGPVYLVNSSSGTVLVIDV
jgi:DNA-binding beta-propeller fold protein YncE